MTMGMSYADWFMKHFFILLTVFASIALHAAESRVLIVVGPSKHPPGSHEVVAGGRLIKHCVENMANLPGVKADVVEGWPGKALRDALKAFREANKPADTLTERDS